MKNQFPADTRDAAELCHRNPCSGFVDTLQSPFTVVSGKGGLGVPPNQQRIGSPGFSPEMLVSHDQEGRLAPIQLGRCTIKKWSVLFDMWNRFDLDHQLAAILEANQEIGRVTRVLPDQFERLMSDRYG